MELVRTNGLEYGGGPQSDRPHQPGLAAVADAEAVDGERSTGQFTALGPVPDGQPVLDVDKHARSPDSAKPAAGRWPAAGWRLSRANGCGNGCDCASGTGYGTVRRGA